MANPTGKRYRMPLEDSDKQRLEELLEEVPTETIVQFKWQTEEGRLFIKQVRKLQLQGVPATWMAEALKLSESAINGALSYWERHNSRNPRARAKRRSRTPRPVGPQEEQTAAEG